MRALIVSVASHEGGQGNERACETARFSVARTKSSVPQGGNIPQPLWNFGRRRERSASDLSIRFAGRDVAHDLWIGQG
jgi:hypothetical protein